METDVERYTWLVAYELSEARLASTEGLKNYHLEWARRFAVTREVKRIAWALSKIKRSRRVRQGVTTAGLMPPSAEIPASHRCTSSHSRRSERKQ